MDLQKKTAKIVIFDDEIHICNLIQTLIDFDKLHLNLVGVAHNGVDALDILKRENPEIAICDIRMPGYDGIEVLKAAEELGSKTKFIIISGYREFEYAREGIKLGAVDYLLKPINKEELNSSILRALDEYGIADELGILSHELMTSKSMLREQFILDMKERRVDRTSFTIDNIHNRYSIDFAAEICALCLHVSSDTIHDQKMYDLILEKSTGNIEAQMSQLNADAIIFTIENNLIVLLSEDAGGDEISSLIFDILKLVEQPAGALAGSMVHLGRAQLVRNMQSVEDMQKNVEGVGAVENVDDVEGGVRKMVAIRGNRVEGVENIENVEGVDTVKDIDDVEGIGTVNDAKDVENVDTIENVEAIGTFKDVGDVVNADDVEDVGDVENTKDVEDVGDVEGGVRKMVAIRGNRVEGVENIENIEGIGTFKDVKDVEDVENVGDVGDVGGVENVENIENIEGIGTFKDVKDVEGIKNVDDVKDVACSEGVGGEQRWIHARITGVESVDTVENVENIVGIHAQKFDDNNILVLIEQAITAQKYRLVMPDKSIIEYTPSMILECKPEEYFSKEDLDELNQAIIALSIDKISSQFLRFKTLLLENSDVAPVLIFPFLRYGILRLNNALGTLDSEYRTFIDSNKLLMELDCLNSIDSIFDYFIKQIEAHLGDIFTKLNQEKNRPIQLAKKLIEERYMDNIGLSDVAAEIWMNPVYFSSLFKKETGENFKDYLIRFRIDQAKDLLKEGNANIAEVGRLVGYSDSKHFSKLFTSVVGINPSRYRKLHWGG